MSSPSLYQKPKNKMSESKVSFARVAGAGSQESVPAEQKTTEANASLAGQAPTTALAAPPQQSHLPTRFLGGDEDEDDGDRSDVRLPRLNIIQGLSGADLKAVKMPDGKNAPDGSLIFKKALYIPQPATLVVAGFTKPQYSEKALVFGQGPKPRLFNTLEEVINAGGTDKWKYSRENREEPTKLPWFVKMTSAIVLIKKWEGISEADAEHFTAIAEDGTAFAAAVFTVKSTGFQGFYVPLKSEQAQGVLKHGFYTRYVKLSTKQDRAFTPVVSIQEPTSDAVRKLAISVRA